MAIKETSLLRLDRATFDKICVNIPEFKKEIETIAHSREEARVNQLSTFFIGNKSDFIAKKKKMAALINKLDGIPVSNNGLEEDNESISETLEIESNDEFTSSEEDLSEHPFETNLIKKDVFYGNIRDSQNRINKLKKSLQYNLNSKNKSKEKKGDTNEINIFNPLESDDDLFEGGEDTDIKVKKKKKKRGKK